MSACENCSIKDVCKPDMKGWVEIKIAHLAACSKIFKESGETRD